MSKEVDLSRWGLHCKWGRWAEVLAEKPALTEEAQNVTTGLADVSKRKFRTSSSSSSSQNVTGEMDPDLWGQLQDHIDIEEMVFAKLPLHAFHRALAVCKKWNSLNQNPQFLQRCFTSSLPKPYFILFGDQACHQAILVQDMQKWVLKPLPSFGFRQPLDPEFQFSVCHGVLHTPAISNQSTGGTVFNLHTKLLHRLPLFPLLPPISGCVLSKLAVDKRSGAYKVLEVWSERGYRSTCVYDSVTGEWTRKPTPSPLLVSNELYSTYCEGVMYMKCGKAIRFPKNPRRARLISPRNPAMLAYNFEHDVWTHLPLSDGHASMQPMQLWGSAEMHRDLLIQGLGEWRGVLRDLTLSVDGGLRLWEFEQAHQKWLEIDRMPTPMLEWFIEPYPLRLFLHECFVEKIKTLYCEQYILLLRQDFPETSGLARFVLYDMERRSWETLNLLPSIGSATVRGCVGNLETFPRLFPNLDSSYHFL